MLQKVYTRTHIGYLRADEFISLQCKCGATMTPTWEQGNSPESIDSTELCCEKCGNRVDL